MSTIERALASIRPIREIIEIPGADRVAIARVDDWTCVVAKEDFQVGDLCVFFEVDSHLPPDDERYAFLEKETRTGQNGRTGPRIKTKKFFKGMYLSQGLAMPLSSFPELEPDDDLPFSLVAGRDVTELLNVWKYEPPERQSGGVNAGKPKGNFPAFVQKTNKVRAQNLPWVYADTTTEYEVTVKRDGSSLTAYHYKVEEDDVRTGVCARNFDLKEDGGGNFWLMAKKYSLIEALTAAYSRFGWSLAFQGEVFGPGIQGNPEKIEELTFELFDMFNISEGCYLTPVERYQVLDYLHLVGYKVQHVPILEIATMAKYPNLQALQDAILADKPRTKEGWVFKALNGNTSFKVISNEYLLKQKD